MKTILVVDDQDRIRRTYHRILERDGYQVVEAPDADTASDILKRNDIHLLLLDIKMPNVDGKILFEIRNMFHRTIKVIICSVYPMDEQKQMIQDADDYFDKSESLHVLRQKIANVLGPQTARKHIVLIDDEQKVRVLYSHILSKAGYHVTTFGDNKNALKYIRSSPPPIDLWILDLAMPQMDGCIFYELVRLKHPKTRVLIASNYDVDTQEFIAFNADGYFDKTEGNEVFVSRVKKLMG